MIEAFIAEESNELMIFMDYANGNSLYKASWSFSELEIHRITKRLLKGIKAMQDENIIHRDINVNNVLVHFP